MRVGAFCQGEAAGIVEDAGGVFVCATTGEEHLGPSQRGTGPAGLAEKGGHGSGEIGIKHGVQ